MNPESANQAEPTWLDAFMPKFGEAVAAVVNHAVNSIPPEEQRELFGVLAEGLVTLHVLADLDPFGVRVIAASPGTGQQEDVWSWTAPRSPAMQYRVDAGEPPAAPE